MLMDVTPCPSTTRSSEMHCPSVLDPDMHLTPRGTLTRMNWDLNSPTLLPTECIASKDSYPKNETAGETILKDVIQTVLDPSTAMRDTEINAYPEETPKTIRVAIATPWRDQENVPNHSSKLHLSGGEYVLSTPPVTPSALEKNEHEDGDTVSISELVGSPVGSPVDERRDVVADPKDHSNVNSGVSEIAVGTIENTSTEQRIVCPTAEELSFFR
jgi:hypothetical protein